MTLDEAVALIAVYLGEPDEDRIDRMSFVFFEDVLEKLGRKLNYDAVVNYAGNSFAKKAWEMINEANPLTKKDSGNTTAGAMKNIAALFDGMPLG